MAQDISNEEFVERVEDTVGKLVEYLSGKEK